MVIFHYYCCFSLDKFRCTLSDAVVWPKSTEEVCEVVKLCHHHRIPMIPFGTGTGFEGGSSGLQVRKTFSEYSNGILGIQWENVSPLSSH